MPHEFSKRRYETPVTSKKTFYLFSPPPAMSKLQASSVRSSVKTVLAQSGEETYKEAGGKKRNFIETIELQVGLKNYDPQRDKRFVSRYTAQGAVLRSIFVVRVRLPVIHSLVLSDSPMFPDRECHFVSSPMLWTLIGELAFRCAENPLKLLQC